jgi:hypothetical protein
LSCFKEIHGLHLRTIIKTGRQPCGEDRNPSAPEGVEP